MGLKRPLHVHQQENLNGDFWYTVSSGNGENLLTSEMYGSRSNAKRAARAFIASIDPAPVVFVFWSGPTLAALQAGRGRGEVVLHTERVRC